MAGGSNNDEEMITGINVTPLVDITLVLLIIFMVTANFIVTPSIPVNLPQAEQSEEATEDKNAGVWIDSEGLVYILDDQLADETMLQNYIRDEIAKNKDVQIVIHADESASHGEVIHTLDLMRAAGASNFGFSVAAPAAEE